MRFRGSLLLPISWGIGMLALGSGSCAIAIVTPGSGGAGGGGTSFIATGPGPTSSAGGAGGSTSGDGGPGNGVAAPCQENSDCAPELLCLADTVNDPIFGGGPAGGFCTAACNTDTDCPQPGAVCYAVESGQPGRCTLSCTLGPPISAVADLFAPLDPSKCLGREDLRCAATKTGDDVCLPTCGEDAQCHAGRVCDPRLAVCVDMAETGLPTGGACDPNAMTDPCSGLCISFSSGVAMCSSPCVLGGAEFQTDDCGGPENGFCAFHAKDHGPGDSGYCSPSCQAQSDCQTPSFWCFSVPTLTQQEQRGYCFAATPCPGGQGDCVASNNGAYLCTDTAYGPYCLDVAFPATPGGTGGAGGSSAASSSAGTGGAASSSAGTGGAGMGGAGGAAAGSSSGAGGGGATMDAGAPMDGGAVTDGGAGLDAGGP